MEQVVVEIMEEDVPCENCSVHSDSQTNPSNENLSNESIVTAKSQTNLQPELVENITEIAKNSGDNVVSFDVAPLDENEAGTSKSKIVKKRLPFTISQRVILPRLTKSRAYEMIKTIVAPQKKDSKPKRLRRIVQKKKKALHGVKEKRSRKGRAKVGYRKKPANGRGSKLNIRASRAGMSSRSSYTYECSCSSHDTSM